MDQGDERGKAEVTRLLRRWRGGDRAALDALMPLVYAELRQLARRSLRARRPQGEPTLQPTALVAEAYLRLVDADVAWNDRVHFFAVAANLMRHILVSAVRRRQTRKRGGGSPLSLDQLAAEGFEIADERGGSPLLQLDAALERLAAFDARKARVIELRCFAGLSIADTALAMELSHATVERDLKVAKAWLLKELGGAGAARPD